ncbi:hypothetical protein SNE40_012401 [Patella caerulea]|uniref:Uncharacterized protein n=1 Tax=Patella caerulea TaxID=87958 RepID=A0AAN8PN77_PATCE
MKKFSSKEPSRSETGTVMSDKEDKMSTLTELSKTANDNMATGELTQPSPKGISPEKNSKRLSDGSKRKQTPKAGNSDLEMKNLLVQILTNQNEMNEKVQIMWNSAFEKVRRGTTMPVAWFLIMKCQGKIMLMKMTWKPQTQRNSKKLKET